MFSVGSFIEKVLLVSMSSAAALGVGEAVLRVAPSLMPPEAQLRIHWRESAKTISVADPHIGFLYPPHTTRTIEQSDVRFTYTTDEFGFRNPSPWPAAADVVIVGDSWVFGYGVSDDEAWITRLRTGFGRPIVNLGLIGAAPQQALRVYTRFGAPLQPKLLIFGFFPGNDIGDGENFTQWLDAGAPGNYDVWRSFRGRVPSRAGSLLARSRLLVTIREVRNLQHSAFAGRSIEWGGGRLQLAPGILSRAAAHAAARDSAFNRVLQAVETMRDTAAAHGTDFLVLLFPAKEEVYLPLVGEPTPQVLTAFLPELHRRGIAHLDLTPAFQAQARAGERLYFEVDGHTNEAGNRVIANAMLRYLASKDRVDERRQRGSLRKDEQRAHQQ